jgi:hypothetical protein
MTDGLATIKSPRTRANSKAALEPASSFDNGLSLFAPKQPKASDNKKVLFREDTPTEETIDEIEQSHILNVNTEQGQYLSRGNMRR